MSMETKKFQVGMEIPASAQEQILGAQGGGCDKISITISCATSSQLASGKDSDSDADTLIKTITTGGKEVLNP